MLFSIIVPIYNVEDYLDRCVTSLIEQTYKDIEIILVDDGSNDRSSEICVGYAAVDDRIRVIHKENGGLSDARNKGLEIADGEYVLFVDSDDYIELDTCERISGYTLSKCDILIADAVVEGGNVRLEHISEVGKVFSGKEYLLQAARDGKLPMAVWVNVYRREFLLKNKLSFKFGILHEDEQFTPRAFLKAKSVICTGIVFYHYVIRGNSITTKKDKRKNACDLYDTCCELEKLYSRLSESELKKFLLDTLAVKYLNIFQVARLWQYGDKYLHKDFVRRNAKLPRTRIKAILYSISPTLYYIINQYMKNMTLKEYI